MLKRLSQNGDICPTRQRYARFDFTVVGLANFAPQRIMDVIYYDSARVACMNQYLSGTIRM